MHKVGDVVKHAYNGQSSVVYEAGEDWVTVRSEITGALKKWKYFNVKSTKRG